MASPGALEFEVDKAHGQIVAVRGDGASVLIGKGEMEIPHASFRDP